MSASNPMSIMLSRTIGQQSYPQSYPPSYPQSYPGGTTSISSSHYQNPLSYAQQINPQGLVQLPSWNAFPVSFSMLFYAYDVYAPFFALPISVVDLLLN